MPSISTYFSRVGKDISSCNQDLVCALEGAGLNFEAVSEPVLDIRGNKIERAANIAHKDTGASLGIVGAGYKITQPRAAFKYLDGMPGGVRFQRGGMLKGGRFFLSAEFDTFEVLVGDPMTAYGIFLSSFDGTWANRIAWVLNRGACSNICRFELGSATVGKVGGRAAKHTKNHEIKLDKFIFELNMAQDNLKQEVKRLTEVPVSVEDMERLTLQILPNDSTRADNIRTEILEYFNKPSLGIHGRTAWDAFNAATAYDTHAATRRETAVASADENAFDALISGRGYADKMLPVLSSFATLTLGN